MENENKNVYIINEMGYKQIVMAYYDKTFFKLNPAYRDKKNDVNTLKA